LADGPSIQTGGNQIQDPI